MRKAVFVATALVTLLLGRLVLEIAIRRSSTGPVALAALALTSGLWLLLVVTWASYKTRAGVVLGRIWLVLLSTAGTYLAVDLTASAVMRHNASPPMLSDGRFHHVLQPATDSSFSSPDYKFAMHVNSQGLRRSQDLPPAKPRDRYWILMLGDSFTMGKGVADAMTFSSRLEAALGAHGPGRKVVEVLNGGVDSYSPILSLLELRKLIGLRPDLVVLNLDMSDLMQETVYRQRAIFDADGDVVGVDGRPGNSPTIRTINMWIYEYLYVTRYLIHLLGSGGGEGADGGALLARANFDLLAHTLAGDRTDRRAQWRDLFDSILRMKKVCDEHQMGFLLTVYPWGHQVSATEWVPGRSGFVPNGAVVSDQSIDAVTEFARNQGIELLNVFPAFRAYQGSEPLYFRQDMHWTAAGHAVMAAELDRYIRSRRGSN